jgi:hypothetical protein
VISLICGSYCRGFFAGLKRPPDRAEANLILLGQLRHGGALGVAVGNHALLAVTQGSWPPELGALSLGALDALLATLLDQAALLRLC